MQKVGRFGWLGLAAYVVAFDAWAIATKRETLSSSFANALNHPIKRVPVIIGASIVYGHLMVPPKYHKYDPVRIIGGYIFNV